MKESETLIIKNSRAGNRNSDRRAEEISKHLKHVSVRDFNELQRGEIRRIPEKVIILGGDGTIQGSITWFKANDESPILIAAGGGTGNDFRKNLVIEGATLALNDINDFEKLRSNTFGFKPAVVKGDGDQSESVFVISAGFGKIEQKHAKYREVMRQLHLPISLIREINKILPILVTSISPTNSSEEPILHIYCTTAFLQGVNLFPNEDLGFKSTKLGRLEIKNGDRPTTTGKLLYAFLLWRLGISSTSPIVSSEINTTFHLKPSAEIGTKVAIDGELRQVKGANLTIRRSNAEFLVAALV